MNSVENNNKKSFKKITKAAKKYNLLMFSLSVITFGFIIFYIWASITGFPNEKVYYDPDSHAWEVASDGRIGDFVGKAAPFFYFTIQGGIIFGITMLLYYLPKKWKRKLVSNEFVLAVVIYQIIIFVLFWTTISPFIKWDQIPITLSIEITMHGIVPVVSVWFFYVNRKKLIPKESTINFWGKKIVLTPFMKGLIVVLIYPIVYFLFALIFYFSINGKAAIYPFLNFYKPFSVSMHPALAVLLNIVIFAVNLLLFTSLYLVAFWLVKKSNKDTSKLKFEIKNAKNSVN